MLQRRDVFKINVNLNKF